MEVSPTFVEAVASDGRGGRTWVTLRTASGAGRGRIGRGMWARVALARPSDRKATRMHAVVINVSFTDRAAAQASLGELVPRVSGSPGFVSGYWVGLSESTGASIAVFDSEDQARA